MMPTWTETQATAAEEQGNIMEEEREVMAMGTTTLLRTNKQGTSHLLSIRLSKRRCSINNNHLDLFNRLKVNNTFNPLNKPNHPLNNISSLPRPPSKRVRVRVKGVA